MPIPFILGGLALGAAVLGAGAHLSASDKRKEAEETYSRSNGKQKRVGKLLEDEQAQTTKISADLGKLKLNIQKNEIAKFLDLYKKLKVLNIKGFQEENIKFNFTAEQIRTMEKVSMSASEMLGSGVTSVASGVLAGAGIYGSVMSLGVASTGTAIGTLSGAAATNATLAWLGGGSIAAGGGGMAVGSAVLGGLVAGPAILVSGAFADSKAEKALTEAKEFEAKVDVACAKMENQISKLKGVQVRCGEFKTVLNQLCQRLNPQLSKLEVVVSELTANTNAEPTDKQMKEIHLSFLMAKTLKDILDLNILDKQGEITSESKNVQQRLISAGI